jgi:hypothetical protein
MQTMGATERDPYMSDSMTSALDHLYIIRHGCSQGIRSSLDNQDAP